MYTDKRFAYNPYNDIFIDCGDVHATALYNKGYTKDYDNFIRGILYDGILYLRVYYPFADINDKDYRDILKASKILLQDNIDIILTLIKKEYGIIPDTIEYNVTNDILSGIGIINI